MGTRSGGVEKVQRFPRVPGLSVCKRDVISSSVPKVGLIRRMDEFVLLMVSFRLVGWRRWIWIRGCWRRVRSKNIVMRRRSVCW
jgi:hypothetical protein